MAELTIIAGDEAKGQSIEELFAHLASSPKGLSMAEAGSRLAEFGLNALVDKKVNPLLKFLSYFWGPIPWMIEVAAILSAIVRHWDDLIIISVLLFFNALVGFWQEYKAANALEPLKDGDGGGNHKKQKESRNAIHDEGFAR
jgi:H+-transporting ATPase